MRLATNSLSQGGSSRAAAGGGGPAAGEAATDAKAKAASSSTVGLCLRQKVMARRCSSLGGPEIIPLDPLVPVGDIAPLNADFAAKSRDGQPWGTDGLF